MTEQHTTHAVIIGAGPVGLFAAFQLGMLNLDSHIIDMLPQAGGQCAQLYPEKPIHDIPAFSKISGQELTDRLIEQLAPFNPTLHLNQSVLHVDRQPDGTFLVKTDIGTLIQTPVVVIAAGGGAFLPKRPPIANVADYEGTGIQYSVRKISDYADEDVVILGGGDSAVDWALTLCDVAKSVTIVHRRNNFRAAPEALLRMDKAVKDGSLSIVIGQATNINGPAPEITSVSVKTAEGMIDCPASRILPFFGLTSAPGPLEEWGLAMEDGRLCVDTERFETSQSGIFAIGDIAVYPGKLKLILSGFHEAALMAHAAHPIAAPDERIVFQHSTSSPSLLRKLGQHAGTS
ncbi:MAG: NAD(P)/FAD-dependent oxidoreductase [Marinomonas sp.]